MKYKITLEEAGILAVFEGNLDTADIKNCIIEIQANEKYSEYEYGIFDYTKADLSNIEIGDVLAELFPLSIGASFSLPFAKVAIVAVDPHTVNINKSYRNKLLEFGIKWGFEIFSNQTDARNWIDLTSRWR
ncbi:MAG: hypothetical protein AB3N10_11155 [Allomuricauda sp.]